MDSIKERLTNPVVSILVGVAIGLLLGLIWGYVIAPVQWYDASPGQLRGDLQIDYMRMTIDSFSRTTNIQEAQRRLLEMGAEAAQTALASVEVDPQHVLQGELELFKSSVVSNLNVLPDEEAGDAGTPIWLWFLCILVLVVGGGFGLTYLLRRVPMGEAQAEATLASEPAISPERTDYVPMDEAAPIAQFMTTYMLGDDLFDDSFSIDSAAGEFLGECGVGIAETAGPGEPKRVNAFEVWLFDKNDIQTVTKVVMSESAYHDVTTHDRLSSKGDPVLAEPDRPLTLDTETLRLSVRIVDLSYGDDPMLPGNSYFNQVTLELSIWPR